MRYITSIILGLMIGVFIANAQVPTPQNAVAQCETAIAERIKQVGDTYLAKLTKLKSQFQEAGDEEKGVATFKEWSRFLHEKTLSAEDIVEQPEELRQLQKQFISLFAQVPPTVAQEQIATLTDIQQQFIKDGKPDDGLAVQQVIEKIKQRYLAMTATKDSTDPKP